MLMKKYKSLGEVISRCSMKGVGRRIGLDVRMVDGHLECSPLDREDPRFCADFVLPSRKMVEACRADDFGFFRPFIDAGRLTVEQMHRAATRYHLGKTKSGFPMFWMIDETFDPQDAHIGSGGWVSTLLKKREPFICYWRPTHCLFGLHLLQGSSDNGRSWSENGQCFMNDDKAVAIVESEASAVVLSEIFPECIWMAYATAEHLRTDLFSPLVGRTVIIFPRTDPYMSNWLFFNELAASVRRQYGISISVDTTLEDYASDGQKRRCIDLTDFLLESQVT